jgi:hypothetical protein
VLERQTTDNLNVVIYMPLLEIGAFCQVINSNNLGLYQYKWQGVTDALKRRTK